MLTETEDECSSSVRLLEIERNSSNTCGFHLTRSKWDPYPWVSAVDGGSAAEAAGLRPGDCLLEVNGEDVLGQHVSEIAEMVRSRPEQVSLLLWNVGVEPHCTPESLCCGPMPTNLQRLSMCMSSILSAMECPICLDTIPPPANQCVNGHLMCARCHAKSERCPVCRIRLTRGRSLFADQVYNSVTDAFDLYKESDEKIRKAKIKEIFKSGSKNKKIPEIKITQSHTNKFLSRVVEKSSSAENLTNQFLGPRTYLSDEEFNSGLKTKSLSTSEICCPGSPGAVSRSGRVNFKTGFSSRPKSSLRRSFESLDGRICLDQEKNLSEYFIDDLLYNCPFSIKCSTLIKSNNIIRHFQEYHDGPFVQYFKPKISFNLLNQHNDTYCILHAGKYFFLKIYSFTDHLHKDENLHDILIWMWLMSEETLANEYQLQIYIYYSSLPKKKLFSLNSAIYSLNNMSWYAMKNMQKGVFVSKETLKALNQNSSDSIILDIEIKNCIK